MLARYVRTRDEIKKVDAVFDLTPNTAVHRRIEALLADLRVFNNVTIKLQRDISRGLQRYPSLKPQLNASANVVHSPVFEAAVVKVIKGGSRLSTGERDAIKAFEKAPVTGTKRKSRPSDEQKQEEE
ncbi:hypothetical protein L917_19648 [Phytophthora nicotianae]|uniref:Uncharacterized protein n=1 Tax=Phytophthora nicotianae TaxID=4792 RepID=W2K5W2_PHYNI|nr:hypothetical protein L917_19648 [Phytophthora nicotianae]